MAVEVRQDIIDSVASKLGASNVEVGTHVRHYAEEFERVTEAEDEAKREQEAKKKDDDSSGSSKSGSHRTAGASGGRRS